MTGFYRMQRGWVDHPVFGSPKREPFDKRSAWAWLIDRAAWQSTRASINGRIVELQRGQLTASVRFLAETWGWSKSKVSDFCPALVRNNMITYTTRTGQMVITICNYDKYQAQQPSDPDEERTGAGQAPDTGRTNKKEVKEGKKESPPIGPPHDPPAKASRRKPKVPLPDAWAPKARHYDEGAQMGHDPPWVQDFGETYRNKCLASGYVYVNHDDAFSEWMRVEHKRGVNGSDRRNRETPAERRFRQTVEGTFSYFSKRNAASDVGDPVRDLWSAAGGRDGDADVRSSPGGPNGRGDPDSDAPPSADA